MTPMRMPPSRPKRSTKLQRITLIATTIFISSATAFTTPTSLTQNRQLVTLQSKTAAAAAASAWLFTPERTGAILADTVSDAALKATAASADVLLDAAIVTTDTVVKTVYKAPFLSLALSFLFGGLFFSTVAAGVAAVYAFGKENTRRFKEVAGILWRRNWDVFRMSLAVTRVSSCCNIFSTTSCACMICFSHIVYVLRNLERSVGKRKVEWFQE